MLNFNLIGRFEQFHFKVVKFDHFKMDAGVNI